jgi:energy-coupling factor transport system permease/ATP-binding protein
MLIQLKDVEYSYPQTEKKALDKITFSVEKGEYIAIVGANGSGKSTLARIIAGFIKPSDGTCIVNEDQIKGIVFQQPKEQIVAGIVERDTAFGPQNLLMPKSEIELRTLECLAATNLVDKAFARTFELSLGQTQRLAFSGILALFPDILILDEATAMLDPSNRKFLLSITDSWYKKGHTIISITHDREEALKADRIIALENGKIIFDDTSSVFKRKKLLNEKIFASPLFYKKSLGNKKNKSSQTVLSVKNISFSYPDTKVFENISFSLKKGSLTALTGPSGCGKSTLLECLAGLLECKGGKIFSKGRPSLALQESDAALFETFAADDVAFGPINQSVEKKDLLERVKKSMAMCSIPYEEYGNRQTSKLSGGEKRKLSLASIIALDSEIILFDEPTAGLDPVSRQNIMSTLKKLAEEGKTILFSTHRREEAEFADTEIAWDTLCKKNNSSKKEKENNLPEVKVLSNAKILKSLSRVSNIFMAPPKISHSLISILPPVLKYILFLALFITAFAVKPFYLSLIMLVLSFIYAFAGRQKISKPLKAYLKLLPWLLIFAVFQFFFALPEEGEKFFIQWGLFSITPSKIILVSSTLIKTLSALLLIGTFIKTSSERNLLDGLNDLLTPLKWLHVPVRYAVLTAGIIFRFIPIMLDVTASIIKTQLIRGGLGEVKGFKKIRAMIPLFIPMMLETLKKAEIFADALTARYFS